jgi:hypothetical protein
MFIRRDKSRPAALPGTAGTRPNWVLIVFAVALCLTAAVRAQGIVNFNNSPSAVGGDGAPVSDFDGTRLAGTGFLAQLYGGPDIHTLQPTGEALTFRTGSGAGFFNTTGKDTIREIPMVLPGQIAAIRILVWDANYISWEAAVEAGGTWTASSDLYIKTGSRDLPGPPPNLIGLQPFGMRLPTTLLSTTKSGPSLAVGS